ncbi:hypothetical protein BCV71DRAFT_189509 [Rhizopus microsporus]|uniref:Uncharacterized protein n=1 Tax=Rhizopus microsporus TaxID=58291 RepID=A0A1X0RMW2_RHIZD|nr:hypothetical protein BCV71DRAFT_189509 [Rhizopus microsporus]
MDEEIVQRIANLVNVLASQQQNNQQLALDISKQILEVKQKAGTVKCLPEVDQPNAIPSSVPPEQRDEVIDSLKSQLAKALSEQEAIRQQNQELEKERDALQNLVKEYENGLETVTNKLRAYANAAAEGEMRLRREFNALLEAEKGTSATLFTENILLQMQLTQLAKTLRVAFEAKSLDGCYEEKIAQLEQEKKNFMDVLGISAEESEPDGNRSPILHIPRTGGVIEEFFDE